MLRHLILLAATAISFYSNSASAATINVPADQATVKAAVAAAVSGDVIILAPGTYNESGIVINKSNLTVASRFRTTGDRSFVNTTILTGGGTTIFDIAAGTGVGFELDGVRVTKTYKPVVANDRISVKNCIFYDNDSDTISFEANGYGYVGYNQIDLAGDDGIDIDSRRSGASFKIEHNIVRNSGDDGIEIRLYDFSGSAMTYDLTDNEFSGSDEDGIQLIDYSGASARTFNIARNILANNAMAGLGCTASGNTVENYNGSPMVESVQLVNNTIVGNRVGLTGGTNIKAVNNLIAHNVQYGVKYMAGSSLLSYSILFNNGVDSLSTNLGAGVIQNVDPMIDAATFQLKSASPAIDKGTTAAPFMGAFNGVAPDLGAKEFGGVVLVPVNRAPVVDAGLAKTVLVNEVSLLGSASDDGLPSSILSLQWSLVSGPAAVLFSAPNSLQTLAQFSSQGTYRLRLTVSDGSLSASDDVIIRYANEGSGTNAIIDINASNYIEAEAFAYSFGSATRINDALASGSAAMQAPLGMGIHSYTEHRLNMSAASATYYIFVRARSGTALAGALDVSVNDSILERVNVPNNSFSWIRLQSINLEAGNWPMIIKATSEGVVWDRIAISTSSTFVPGDVAPPPPVLTNVTLSYLPVADAMVNSSLANSNYGTATKLLTDLSPTYQSYMKFSLPALNGTVVSAKLRLYVVNSSSNGPKVFLAESSTWTESGLTYGNRPVLLSAALDAKSSVVKGWVEYNVTAAVMSGGIYTFAMLPSSSDGMDFYSREGANPPQLVVVVGSATAPVVIAPTPTPTPTPAPTVPTTYIDDSQSTLNRSGNKVVLSGNYGYVSYEIKSAAANTTIDARGASFTVANSKNSNPTASNKCSSGSLSTNEYPIKLRDSTSLGIVGALVNGLVPQHSDWSDTYCNSAAINFFNSPGAIIDAARVNQGWDSIRFSSGSPNWIIKDSYVSNSHDDCIENDYGHTGLVKDSLFDGCYMGLSMAPGNSEVGGVVTLDGVLMKMKAYLTEGAVVEASPFKFDDTANDIVVKNTIIAYDSASLKSLSRTQRAWSKMKSCSNNLILWMPDTAMPSDYPTPPSCFQIVKGQAARDLWTKARQNWINCHPKVRLASGDVAGNASLCDASFWGGKN